jgi:hypothetical protein
MSPSPEFPEQNDQIIKSPHAGGDEVPEDIREEPARKYRETPLFTAAADHLVVPDNLNDGFSHAPFSEEEQAQLRARQNPTPENKSFLRKGLMIGGSVGAAAVAGVLFATSLFSGAKEEDNKNASTFPPLPEITNSAPAVPIPAPEKPIVTATGQTNPETDKAVEIKFYDETGVEVSPAELSKSVKLTIDKYPNGTSAMGGFYENIEAMMNRPISDDETRNNLGYPADKELTKADYLAASRLSRQPVYESLFTTPSGNLHTAIDKLAENTASYQYDTRNEADPYKIAFQYQENRDSVLVSDNSMSNSVQDDPKTYEFIVDGGYGMERSIGQNGEKPAWKVPGKANFTLIN